MTARVVDYGRWWAATGRRAPWRRLRICRGMIHVGTHLAWLAIAAAAAVGATHLARVEAQAQREADREEVRRQAVEQLQQWIDARAAEGRP